MVYDKNRDRIKSAISSAYYTVVGILNKKD